MIRKPTKSELELIEYLIGEANYTPELNWKETLMVSPMDDGGMGSLRLFTEKRCEPNRIFGRAISSCAFYDMDKVPVCATLITDQDNKLFELDMFKGDFSKLINIPHRDCYTSWEEYQEQTKEFRPAGERFSKK
ncbi:MAG: hypothetical protein IJ562_12430 [Prevotella sp.]|nr:hypothetical protein [Prevotella sp.]